MDNKTYKLLVGVIVASLLAVVVVIVVIVSLNNTDSNSITASTNSPNVNSSLAADPDKPWHANMVLGSFAKTKNHFVEYADPMCGYCGKFSLALIHNSSELYSKYLNNNKLTLEVRLTDFLQQSQEDNSTRAAEYAYCAADQNKFFDYYDSFMTKLDKDYFSKGIGSYHGAPEIPHLVDSYYDGVASQAGVDSASLSSCLSSGKGQSLLNQATVSAQKIVTQGLPSFNFNSFTTSGFDGSWETVKKMFAAGGVS
ncbi:MAG: thioredoxin domain-containing protein [Bifidobacteriaceae bacterium]|jgi:hypothetical protein|nr:thioredoxin domain-containing protein [Bifidobacteriaceae bacterium]